jgi:hypothetical protein
LYADSPPIQNAGRILRRNEVAGQGRHILVLSDGYKVYKNKEFLRIGFRLSRQSAVSDGCAPRIFEASGGKPAQ